MQINHLTLTNFRAFEQAKFEFQPRMNLLIGINGVGKSTVLDALRIALSRVLPKFTACIETRLSFSTDDIMIGHDQLAVEVNFQVSEIPFICNVRREKSHKKVAIKPDSPQILQPIKTAENQPLVVYFSTRRSILTEARLNPNRSLGNQSAAFADALTPRMLRLREFTDWWLVQEKLLGENPQLAQRRIDALNGAVSCFLDWCTDVRANRTSGKSKKTTLLLDKDGITLNINQLSDGERGILALILDLVQRLLQANPDLEDPLQDGKALVLIDELDLHLHPRWQRMVVQKLTNIFPNCQFIATTHSPQIIGEVQPTGLILLKKEDAQVVVIQEGLQSFGLDSSWILKHLMETEPRNKTVQAQINSIEDSLEEGDLELARNQLDTLKRMIGSDDETSRFEASINNLEALADEADSEEE